MSWEPDHSTLIDLQQVAFNNAEAHGFHEKVREFPEIVALIHSEVSEALEAWRDRGFEDWKGEGGKPEGVMAELADVIIRIWDFTGSLENKHALYDAIIEKMAYNANRPYRHGGKLA